MSHIHYIYRASQTTARNPHSPDYTKDFARLYNIYLVMIYDILAQFTWHIHTHGNTYTWEYTHIIIIIFTFNYYIAERRRHRRQQLASLFWPARWRFKRKIHTWFMIAIFCQSCLAPDLASVTISCV